MYLRNTPHANPLRLLEDAARGLQYLHSMDLVHGDLKGANILVSEEGRACLTDVGLARVADDLDPTTATPPASTTNVTIVLRSPQLELLVPERFGSKEGSRTKKTDIYSMGMTIYEVLADKIPFYEHENRVAGIRILDGVRLKAPDFTITRDYTEELWGITKYCWDQDPLKRPTVDYVLSMLGSAAEQWKPKCGGDVRIPKVDQEYPSPTDQRTNPAGDRRRSHNAQ